MFIVIRNSALVRHLASLFLSNSTASIWFSSLSTLRSRYVSSSSFASSSNSSILVPLRLISIAGQVLLSTRRLSRCNSILPVALNSSKITSSIFEPVSINAVAKIVSEPPFSTFLAAPKNFLGICIAPASTPPVRILPECGCSVLRHGQGG